MHHGITELRVLPGNVRYMKVAAFFWTEGETTRAYDDAVRFLKDGEAIVIDVRGNGGGDALAVRYLVSHFVGPNKLLLTFLEGGKAPEEFAVAGGTAVLPPHRQAALCADRPALRFGLRGFRLRGPAVQAGRS